MPAIGRSRAKKFRPEKNEASGGGSGGSTTETKKKEPGKIKKFFGKVRKKIIPTFGEQHETARKEGKKTFKSTRKKKEGSGWFGGERGKLHYATTKKEDVEKKIAKSKAADAKAKEGKGGGADSGSKKKPVYEKATGTKVSKRGQAFAAARKAGKKFFMFEGKKYHTRLKGEEKKQPGLTVDKRGITFKLPEMSGGTSKKIKRAVGAKGGGRIAGAARRAQEHGWYSPDMGMKGRRMYAKGGLIKGKPKLAVKGW